MKTENYNCDYYDVENDIKNNLNDQQQIEINKGLSYEDRMRYEGGQYYIKSEDEMKALFP